MIDLFEDHCWQNVIPSDVMKNSLLRAAAFSSARPCVRAAASRLA
jgi:hypothetical protein